MTTEELPPFGQIHQSSFAGHASASKRIPAHKHPHKSFVITRVATVKALHQVWYGLLMLAREVQGDRKWDLGEYINLHRSAKYSSNFTPEWIKTWPFIFFLLVTGENLKAPIQPSGMRHMFPIIQVCSQQQGKAFHLFHCSHLFSYSISFSDYLSSWKTLWCLDV